VSKRQFALGSLLLILAIAYGGTVVGPAGLNFVPITADEAWHRFIGQITTWVPHGSDQRSDWMGNLLMLVPLGYALTGSLTPPGRLLAPLGALLVSVAVILGVKYAQIYFPPRTVTLNYVAAQTVGAAIGIILFRVTHGAVGAALRGIGGAAIAHLRVMLLAYTAGVLIFMLMPLDFALDVSDLRVVLDRLPGVVTTVTGEGRPLAVRAALVAGGTLALVPVGMLLTITRDHGRLFVGRGTAGAMALGFVLMAAVLGLNCLVLSAAPSLLSVFYRTAGIGLGAALLRAVVRRSAPALRRRLKRAMYWLVLPYLALLLVVNGLISAEWRTPGEAIDNLYWLGLLPGFDYYIVSKAEAARNIVAHAIMYAPVGVAIWLVAPAGEGRGVAFCLGGALSLLIELGRYLRPGLEGDINAVAIGAGAAWLAARLMAPVWRMIESISLVRPEPGSHGIGWRDRAAANLKRREAGLTAAGDIEQY
jgi:VanZ like family